MYTDVTRAEKAATLVGDGNGSGACACGGVDNLPHLLEEPLCLGLGGRISEGEVGVVEKVECARPEIINQNGGEGSELLSLVSERDGGPCGEQSVEASGVGPHAGVDRSEEIVCVDVFVECAVKEEQRVTLDGSEGGHNDTIDDESVSVLRVDVAVVGFFVLLHRGHRDLLQSATFLQHQNVSHLHLDEAHGLSGGVGEVGVSVNVLPGRHLEREVVDVAPHRACHATRSLVENPGKGVAHSKLLPRHLIHCVHRAALGRGGPSGPGVVLSREAENLVVHGDAREGHVCSVCQANQRIKRKADRNLNSDVGSVGPALSVRDLILNRHWQQIWIVLAEISDEGPIDHLCRSCRGLHGDGCDRESVAVDVKGLIEHKHVNNLVERNLKTSKVSCYRRCVLEDHIHPRGQGLLRIRIPFALDLVGERVICMRPFSSRVDERGSVPADLQSASRGLLNDNQAVSCLHLLSGEHQNFDGDFREELNVLVLYLQHTADQIEFALLQIRQIESPLLRALPSDVDGKLEARQDLCQVEFGVVRFRTQQRFQVRHIAITFKRENVFEVD
mmetsp:Transcript_11363/g.21896  ORF Transcript_11363/g.21896 Transcript_11363/m.21896 type:complete len:560 (-) Transcript_11363:165-1844(-)